VYQTLRFFVFCCALSVPVTLSAITSLFLYFLELGLASLLVKLVLSSRVVALSANPSLSLKIVELGLASLLAKPILRKKVFMCSTAKHVAITLSS